MFGNDFEYYHKESPFMDSKMLILTQYTGNNSHVVIPSTIEKHSVAIITGTFQNYTPLESVTLPTDLFSILNKSFFGCENLKRISLPYNVISIGERAFQDCINLEEIILEGGNKQAEHLRIESNAFENCPKLYDENGLFIIGSLLVSYVGKEVEFTVPSQVTVIAANAFHQAKQIQSVHMSDSVTVIGENAFSCCQKLQEIHLSENITEIQAHAFSECSALTQVILPKKLKTIAYAAFSACIKLRDIQWNDCLASIGADAFSKCHSLEEISLPDEVFVEEDAFIQCKNLRKVSLSYSVSLENKAFSKCTALETVEFIENNQNHSGHMESNSIPLTKAMEEKYRSEKEALHPSLLRCFGKGSMDRYRALQLENWSNLQKKEKQYFIDGWNQPISNSKRKGKNASRNLVFLKSSAKEMSIYFDEGCHLEYPELDFYLSHCIQEKKTAETAILLDYKNKRFSAEYIDEMEQHKELMSIGLEPPTLAELREKWKVSATKKSIEILAYHGKETREIIPDSIDTGVPITTLSSQKIGSYNPIKQLILPASIVNFHNSPFADTSLEEIELSPTMTKIPHSMFKYAYSLTKIDLHEGITEIYPSTFFDCISLKEIHFPSTLECIGSEAFRHCSALEKIVCPIGLKKIEDLAFYDCSQLEEVILPEGFESLEHHSFTKCSKLKKVIFPSHDFDFSPINFKECSSLSFVGQENGENLLHLFKVK